MATECGICIEPYKDASSIPCGHVFCLSCLHAHIALTSQDGLNATCPTCRTEFTFSTPDLSLVMKPLHKHLHPSIRRVFVDTNTKELDDLKVAYKKQADDAEKRINDMQGKLDEMETQLKASEEKLKLSESKNPAQMAPSEASTSRHSVQDRPSKRQKMQAVQMVSFSDDDRRRSYQDMGLQFTKRTS
ncbi:hypothetical protein BDZ89DRAFT_1082878 [Hymenopellis radicata]|nr:hypothetical protein BDZ89DRAFT_1082878 [Hymenopellis radicata]